MSGSDQSTTIGLIATISAAIYYVIQVLNMMFTFFSEPIHIVYTIIGCSVCLGYGVYIYRRWKKDVQDHTYPTVLKRNAVFLYVLVSLPAFTFLGFQLKNASDESAPCPDCKRKERIVVLIPFDRNSNSLPPFQDGKRQAFGFIDLLEKNPGVLDKYEFIFKNHEMNPDKAVEIVSEELSAGTKYFVSTMSEVSKRLSYDFQTLIKSNYQFDETHPKLITTVSSSNQINLIENSVYRFYIRSEEEALLLGEYYKENIRDGGVCAIVVKDNYGETARSLFREVIGKPLDANIFIEKSWTKSAVVEKLTDELKNVPFENQTYFIVHYGSGLDNIVSALAELGRPGELLISHPITVNEWNTPVSAVLDSFTWTTCYAESETGGTYNSEDVIRDFTYFTLHRLVQSIDAMKATNKSFDEIWKNCREPHRIKYLITKEGDSEITLLTKTYPKK